MFFLLPKKIHKKKGFSIGEVVLAMFLLAVGIVAIMNLISGSLGYSLDLRDRIIGAELAQEGIELVRNVRDHDFAQGGDGFSGFGNSKHCILDYRSSQTSLNCGANYGSMTQYYLQEQNGFYGHFNNTFVRFSRYVYVDYNPGQDTALVRSFVYWNPSKFMPSTNGNPENCTVSNFCVFTELYLTSWR